MASPNPSTLFDTGSAAKDIRHTCDQILTILQNHNFSDTSLTNLVDALLQRGLLSPGHSPAIAMLCNQLKTNIRWHATASQSAAFQMTLSARLNGEFYRDWDTTSKTLENWTSFYGELFIAGVVSIYNVWHAALHVARSFDTPSRLIAIVVALERCKAYQPSERLFERSRELAEKVTQRLEELEKVRGHRAKEDGTLYDEVVLRIRALALGRGGDNKESFDGPSNVVHSTRRSEFGPGLPSLEGFVEDLEFAIIEIVEKGHAGKSKAE